MAIDKIARFDTIGTRSRGGMVVDNNDANASKYLYNLSYLLSGNCLVLCFSLLSVSLPVKCRQVQNIMLTILT